MKNIVAEIVEVLKSSKDTIELEQRVHKKLGEFSCEILSKALGLLDDELWREYQQQGARSCHRDDRTLVTSYGEVKIKRRLLKLEDGHSFYALDQEMGFMKRQRMSPYLQYCVAQIASKSSYRATAKAVDVLTNVSLSHAQVGNILKTVGKAYKAYEQTQLEHEVPIDAKLKRPKVLRIEGDAVEIKGRHGKRKSLHRFQIAEGVEQSGQRHRLTDTHCVSSLNHAEAVRQIKGYLEQNYDLSETVVLSNSDGGPGYGKEVFDEILGATGAHEHFRDSYHVNEKCKQRLNFVTKDLVADLQRKIWQYDEEGVHTLLDTAESLAEDTTQLEQVKRLGAYLKRNWKYLKPLSMRKTGIRVKGLGACESNHRLYSYRMKKQGRIWSEAGAEAIAKIITGQRNGDLARAMSQHKEGYARKPSREYKDAVRNALKKLKAIPHIGAQMGRIAMNCPSSSAIGRLSQSISFCGINI